MRPSDIELLIGVQQKLTERVMLDVQWTRHSFGNLFATQYLATPASAYSSYCATVPVNPQMPGGGNQLCGFQDINPAFFGITPNNFVTGASKLGNVADVYTGLDVNLQTRFAGGGQASGGVSMGRERTDYCSIASIASIGSNTNSSAGAIFSSGNNITLGPVANSTYPSTLYCSVTPPYQPDWKALATYPLPWWGLNASATWQNRPGAPILANEAASLSSPTLNRPLSLPTATVNFIAPGALYDPRINQIDARLAKTFKFDRARLQVTAGAYNLAKFERGDGPQ